MIGDIIIIPTTPLHIGSRMDDSVAMCEDGEVRPYPHNATVAYTALDMVKSLEAEVLRQHETG